MYFVHIFSALSEATLDLDVNEGYCGGLSPYFEDQCWATWFGRVFLSFNGDNVGPVAYDGLYYHSKIGARG